LIVSFLSFFFKFSTSLSSYLPFSLFFSYRVIRLLPELRKSAEDAAFEEIRGVCSMAEQVLQQYEGGGVWTEQHLGLLERETGENERYSEELRLRAHLYAC